MDSDDHVPSDELIEHWKSAANERASMLEDNRDEDDMAHYDGLGDRLDEISRELVRRGIRNW